MIVETEKQFKGYNYNINILDDNVSNMYSETFNSINTDSMESVNKINKSKKVIELITKIISKYENEDEAIDEIINTLSKRRLKNSQDANEPFLREDNRRFTIYPVKYNAIWEMYKKQLACFWKVEEIDFSKDQKDFETLRDEEKHFLKMILAFFAASDGIVNFNLSERFTKDIKVMEAQVVYAFQMMMENIHGEAYSLMLDNIIKDKNEREYMFNAIENIPSVKAMADWAFKWIDSSASFAHRVVAFAIVEGVFFSGAFAAIFWFKKYKNKGKMFLAGLTKSNEFIARDEGMHTDFACLLYSYLDKKLPEEVVYNIMDEAVGIAKKFMDDALPYKLLGMNANSMGTYKEYIADRLLISLGYKKKYNVTNPFKFMETIGLPGKTNFFEMRPTEYQDAHVNNSNRGDYFILDDKF